MIVAVVATMVVSCEKYNPVVEFLFDCPPEDMVVGEELTIVAYYDAYEEMKNLFVTKRRQDSSSGFPDVSWSIDNPNNVVDAVIDGIEIHLTAKKTGTAIVTATSDCGKFTKSCTITVIAAEEND